MVKTLNRKPELGHGTGIGAGTGTVTSQMVGTGTGTVINSFGSAKQAASI